jgi:signal recognition particle subunit SEC65
METSLHRELKRRYTDPDDLRIEVQHGRYRIDAVRGGELVEVQHGSLAAIRDKIRALLGAHRVRVVKPIVASKLLVKRSREQGRIVSRRLSPKRQTMLALFDELVYFTGVFPHARLTLEALLVDIEEWRYPGHGRRRRWRADDYVVEDQKLCSVVDSRLLKTAADLRALVDCDLPAAFHTADLAAALGVPRHLAQRVAYCLRETGAARAVGKRGNAHLYQWPVGVRRRRAA